MTNPNREELLFQLALCKPVGDRPAWLDRECADDATLRQRLDALLAAHEQPEPLLATQPEAARPTIKLEFSDAPDEAVGQTIGPLGGLGAGRYKLLERVGEGGCGVVYVAEQTEPVRRRVALKVIKLGMDTRQVVARFEAERQALAMMDHPNIAKVLDAGTTETGRPYFVMELVRGIKITDYCDQANCTTKERLDLFIKVCQAIQHAHQKGIIHRDIKPSNILVTLHDGVPVPKVIDFGIAKATEGRLTDNTVYTQLHQFIGTPAYMSPEQAEMSGVDIDTRSDIYSLGVLLYELLAGSTPFDAKELMASGIDAMRKTIREKEPPRPSTRLATLGADQLTTTARRRSADTSKLLHQLQGDLDWIVMKCLEKDRQRRYETANGLAADLKRHLNNEPVLARPPSKLYEFQKTVRRHKVGFAATAAIIVVLTVGVLVSTWQTFAARKAQRETEVARTGEQRQRVEAQKKHAEAEAERRRADAHAQKAIESQEHSRRLLYAADMNLAQQSLAMNNLGRARRLLDRHRPQSSEKDLRGWEWRYLWAQSRSDAFAVLAKRPTERALSVSFSPDGTQLAVGYTDGMVERWDVTRRRLLKALRTDLVPACVAFSPRSNILAATAGWGTVKLYDLPTGGEVIPWERAGSIRGLSFTPDGSRLLAFAYDVSPNSSGGASAMVFDLAQRAAVSTNVASGANFLTGIARLSSDGKRLFLSHGDRSTRKLSIKCLDPENGREFWTADLGANLGVSAMAISPDDKILVTATAYDETPIRVLDAETGKFVARLEGHTGWVGEVTFSRDGRWLASAAADQTIRLWETSQWTETRVFRGHEDEVHAVAFSPDGRMLASGSKDGTVLLWGIAARTSPYGHRLLPPELSAVAEYAPGLAIAMGMDAQGLKTVRLRLEDLSESRVSVGSDLTTVFTYLPPNLFAHYEQTNVLRVTEYREFGKEVFREALGPNLVRYPGFPNVVLSYSRESRLIAWSEGPGEESGTVYVASLDQPERRWQWSCELTMPTPVVFSPDGKLLVVAGYKQPRMMEIREVTTGRLILQSDIGMSVREYRQMAAFADAGRKLVAVSRSGKGLLVVFWDLTRPEHPPIRFVERGTLTGLSISPDGRWVSVGSEAGIAVLYDATSMERRHELAASMQAVFSLAFSPDSLSLATGAGGREAIKLWNVETGQELLTLPGKGNLFYDIAFAEDGNTLLLGRIKTPGSWQMWRAPSWAEIAAAEAKDPPSSAFGGPRKPESGRP